MSPNPPSSSVNRPFFGRIEAIRGVGALLVAGYHFTGCHVHGMNLLQHDQWVAASNFQQTLARIGLCLIPGHACLMSFFVISGFVLRVSLEYGPQPKRAATAKFVIARLFRFFPIVFFAGILAAVMAPAATVSARQLVANLLLLEVSLNGHLWALQVELLMVPVILLLFFLERRWGPRVVLGVALTTTGLAFAKGWAVFPPLSVNLFAMTLGMTIPTFGRRFATGLSKRVATGCLVLSVVVCVTIGACLGFYSRYSTVIEAYSATVALTLVAYRPDVWGQKWLDARYLRSLGSASGAYYVLHMATAPLVLAVAALVVPATWSVQAPAVVGIAVLVVWVIAIAPLMVLVSHLVEVPGIKLGRRVIRLLGLDSRPGAQPIAANGLQRRAA
jgi:peptidoglycan/LPS O-acetylase OafA/YrhL